MRTLVHPSSYPASFAIPLTDRMTYTDRFFDAMVSFILLLTPDPSNQADIMETFAPELPHITNKQLKTKTALYLLDTDELIDYHLPTYPNIAYIGGVGTHSDDPLTSRLKTFMDSAINGAVLVSFSSRVKSGNFGN